MTAAGTTTGTTRRRSRRRRVVLLGICLLAVAWGVAAILLVGGAAQDARQAERELQALRERFGPAQLVSGDGRDELRSIQTRFGRAAERLGSPLLVPARALPVVGRQLHSARSLTAAGEEVLASVDDLATVMDDVAARGAGAADRVRAVSEIRAAVQQATERLRAVDLGPDQALLDPLADARDVLAEELGDAVEGAERASTVAAGVEQLLRGGRYVVLAANNAEMQAGWGMPLSVGVLDVDDGELSLGGMEATGGSLVAPGAVPVTGVLARHWAFAQPTVDWRNLALTPHFGEAAPLAAAMWEANGGGPVDGVLALDPFALQAILQATGPVEADGRRIGAGDVIEYVLHNSYVEQEQAGNDGLVERRERQSDIAVAAVEAIGRGGTDLVDLATNLADAAAGRHILLWSSNPTQQAAWEVAGVDGALDEHSLLLGLVNRGGNKLDWFTGVAASATLAPSPEGTEVAVEVTVSNRVPDGEPRYVAGPYGGPMTIPALEAGDWGGYLTVHLPGAALGGRIDGVDTLVAVGPSGPTQLLSAPVVVPKGEDRSFTVRFTLPPGAEEVVIEPSARAMPVRWEIGDARWTDERSRTVKFAAPDASR